MKATPREAATLVLMRERAPGPPEVLMVQRHAKDVFAAGAFVFPGGVLEEADCAPGSVALSERLSAAEAHRRLGSAEPPERALGYFLAALRETFEEVGVLLARTEAGEPWRPAPEEAPALRETRKALREGRIDFGQWLRGRALRPATDALVYFAHWITPEGRPMRFDTRFFLARAEPDVPVEPDQEEIVACRWITPADALAAYHDQSMRMVNATARNLELLARFASTDAALQGLKSLDVRPIRPKLVPQPEGGFRIVHPWDPEYDAI
jgi:8-oxo-dGTP pyrophosphatase MutT (NUDIX family)